MRVAPPVGLSPEKRSQLETWSRDRSTPQRLALRARIVLRAADGRENQAIADELEAHPNTVGVWRRRFLLLRPEGIEREASRPGRNPRLPPWTEGFRPGSKSLECSTTCASTRESRFNGGSAAIRGSSFASFRQAPRG